MPSLSCWAGGDPHRVLELIVGNAVLLGNDIERLASTEQGQCVLQSRPTAGENWLSETPLRIDYYLRHLVGRKANSRA